MKKAALCLSVVTLFFTGLAGCGDMDNTNVEGQEYGFQGRNQPGYHDGRADGTGMGRSYYGQDGQVGRGDDRYGTEAHSRQDRMRGFQGTHQGQQGFSRGITGNDRAGMVDSNGLLNGRIQGFNHQGENLNRGARGMNIDRSQSRAERAENSYYNSDDGRLANQIENRVEDIDGVTDCDVIVNDDDVVIGVEGSGDHDEIESKVRSQVNDMSDNKQIRVVTESEGVEQIHDMENALRDGEPFEEIGATFDAMLDDLGDALQRPFERSR